MLVATGICEGKVRGEMSRCPLLHASNRTEEPTSTHWNTVLTLRRSIAVQKLELVRTGFFLVRTPHSRVQSARTANDLAWLPGSLVGWLARRMNCGQTAAPIDMPLDMGIVSVIVTLCQVGSSQSVCVLYQPFKFCWYGHKTKLSVCVLGCISWACLFDCYEFGGVAWKVSSRKWHKYSTYCV